MRIILDNSPIRRKTGHKKTTKRSTRKMIECEHCHKKTYADARFCHLCGGAMKGKKTEPDILPLAAVALTMIIVIVGWWILSGGQLPN